MTAASASVLLLNMDYRPLKTVGLRKALDLMERGVVEMVEPVFGPGGTALTVGSPSLRLEMPCILRLKRYVNAPQRGSTWSRHGVKVRDRWTCIYCGVHIGDRVHKYHTVVKQDFTVDHLLPQSKGGPSSWGNTACCCTWCNNRKGARTPSEAGMKLRWEPKTPRVSYLVASGDLPEPWKVYLQTV